MVVGESSDFEENEQFRHRTLKYYRLENVDGYESESLILIYLCLDGYESGPLIFTYVLDGHSLDQYIDK